MTNKERERQTGKRIKRLFSSFNLCFLNLLYVELARFIFLMEYFFFISMNWLSRACAMCICATIAPVNLSSVLWSEVSHHKLQKIRLVELTIYAKMLQWLNGKRQQQLIN